MARLKHCDGFSLAPVQSASSSAGLRGAPDLAPALHGGSSSRCAHAGPQPDLQRLSVPGLSSHLLLAGVFFLGPLDSAQALSLPFAVIFYDTIP